MRRYIIANWKCHKSGDEGRRWIDRFAQLYSPHQDVQVVVAPALLHLENLAAYLSQLGLQNVVLAAQDVSPFPRGAYTGAVAADMVKGLARYVIVGHNERRRYFHETNQDVANKVTEAVDSGLIPIVCVDGAKALSQLGALQDLDCDQLLVALTPAEVMDCHLPSPLAKVEETVQHIRALFTRWPVVYGGALFPDNVRNYLNIPALSGLFVGAASLNPESFVEICKKAAAA